MGGCTWQLRGITCLFQYDEDKTYSTCLAVLLHTLIPQSCFGRFFLYFCIKAYFARGMLRKSDLQAAWFSISAWRHRADDGPVSFGFTSVITSDHWSEAEWIRATFCLLKLTKILLWDLFKTRKTEASSQTVLSLFMRKWRVEPWSRWSRGKNVSWERCYCV